MNISFPDNFIWGVAMSAHQVEGSNLTNDWWAMERDNPNNIAQRSLDCCDSWRLYESDVELAKELGFGAFRFSIEWSRIEPEEGLYLKGPILRYKALLERIHELGLKSFVTMHHFSSPAWLTKIGAFDNKKTIDYYARYCEFVLLNLGSHIDYLTPINEPNILAFMGYRMGLFPPNLQSSDARRRATENLIDSHNKCREIAKSQLANVQVGCALSMSHYVAQEGAEERMQRIRTIMEDIYLENSRYDDFIGVQTYARNVVPLQGWATPELETTEMGYEIYPEAIYHTIRRASEITAKPVIITENGIAPKGDEDSVRVKFVTESLQWVRKTIEEGVNVLGYLYWSLLDNFEWNLGYTPRFGLVAIGDNFERIPKQSAYHLGGIAKRNSL